MKLIKQLSLLLVLSIISTNLYAQDQEVEDKQEDLAKELANPLANLITIPIQNNLNINQGFDNDKNVNVINFQPVIPFANGKFITRTIIPVVSIPSDLFPSSPSSSGVGDMNYLILT